MKLEILQENLSRGINTVGRILTNRPSMPILVNVLLKATAGQLEIIASNLETTMTISVGAKVEKPGEFTVPGRTFLETVNGLPAEKIVLELTEGLLTLSGGKFKGKLNGMPSAEFPKLLEEVAGKKATASWELDKNIFQKVIGRLVFCAATDDSRAVLTGVFFVSSASGLTLAAADGFRLSADKITTAKNNSEARFIVPAKALNEISRILGEEKSSSETQKNFKLDFFEEKNEVVFTLEEVKIISRLIAGNFPDYEKIIPPNSVTQIITTTSELIKAVKLAAIFARDSANIVKLKIEKGKLKISANAPQVGENESEVEIKIEKGGEEELAIAFNYRYLLDLLTSLGETELIMEFNGPLASGVFKIPGEENFLHLIMPVRVQS